MSEKPLEIDQHIVSKFIIRKWVHTGDRVAVFDLRRWSRVNPPFASICYARADDTGQGLVLPGSATSLEQDWGTLETAAAAVLREIDDNRLLRSSQREAILDLIALHLLRSNETLSLRNAVISHQAADALDRCIHDPALVAILREDGLSDEEIVQFFDQAIRRPETGVIAQLLNSFADNLPKYLSRYREILRNCGLCLHRPKRTESFLLGDSPAFFLAGSRIKGRSSTGLGPILERARNERLDPLAWRAYMPLSPRLYAVAGPRVETMRKFGRLRQAEVHQLNIQQCRRAQFRVVLPPDQVDTAEETAKHYAARTPEPSQTYPLAPADPAVKWRR